jgi:hypothetical protein
MGKRGDREKGEHGREENSGEHSGPSRFQSRISNDSGNMGNYIL